MKKEVTAHANDVVMKAMSGMFGDRTLKVFGLRTARIVSVFATEVPVVEVKDGLTDFIFVLEDNTFTPGVSDHDPAGRPETIHAL